MDVSLLRMLCVVRQRSLRRADYSSRGVLLGGMYLGVIVKPSILRRPWPTMGLSRRENKNKLIFCAVIAVSVKITGFWDVTLFCLVHWEDLVTCRWDAMPPSSVYKKHWYNCIPICTMSLPRQT
jgi:hypothetical protein